MTIGIVGQIIRDAEVFGADNEKIGKITEVGEHYFLVQHGFLFHKSLYLPIRTVARVDAQRVYLNVPKYEAEAMATEHLPAIGDAWYGTEDATSDGALDETDETSVTNQASVSTPPEPAVAMPSADVAPTGAEAFYSQADTANETVTADAADVPVADAPRDDLHLLDRSVEIPLREQEVIIEKTPVVTGEISIRREIVTDTQRVTDTVRREEARVEATDDTRIHIEGQPADALREDRTRYERMTEAERADYDRRSGREK